MSERRSKKPNGTQTVLLVEGEVLIRMVLSDYLRQCGYRVIEAVNHDEALLVLKSHYAVEILLSEVETTGSIDGFALAKWVRQHRPGVRVILSGTPDKAADAAGELCEAGPLLTKPYDQQLVVDRIRRLLAEKTEKRKSAPAKLPGARVLKYTVKPREILS